MKLIKKIKNWFRKEIEEDYAEKLLSEIKEEIEGRKKEADELLEKITKREKKLF